MRWVLAVVALLCLLLGCSPSPVTRGETVIVLDTDLPVPGVAEVVRLDVYAQDGTWLSARDVQVADPSQWPVSFGVAAPAGGPGRVLVRARAYPKARLRDYAGAARATTSPAPDALPPSTLADLCANAPDLPIGGTVTLRYGETKLAAPVDDGGCTTSSGPYQARSGAGAARVRIDVAGTYRFEVLRGEPIGFVYALFLRRDCADPNSEVACARGTRVVATPSSVLQPAHLEPGTYTLFAVNAVPDQAAELVVAASLAGADAGAPSDADAGVVVTSVAFAPPWPRLLRDGRDETPPLEPREEVTTDALAFVDVVPGELRHVRLVLGGDCVGKPATLSASSDRLLDVGSAAGCEGGKMGPPRALAANGGAPPAARSTLVGAYARGAPCAPTSPDRACAEGGMMLLGSELFGGTGIASSTPERVVRFPTIYVDRDEFSVADYRAALAAGYAPPPGAYIRATDAPLDPRALDRNQLCTFSKVPMGREGMPLNCVTWPVARALCKRRGGDLPTEAVWEYLARKAGRPLETLYPWGNDDPTCDHAIYDRVLQGAGTGACATSRALEGPQPRETTSLDETPLGLRNLAGSMAEWCVDAFASYTQSCWLGARVDAPRCELGVAPAHSVRGGSFVELATGLPAPLRSRNYSMDLSAAVGFRCVYEAP